LQQFEQAADGVDIHAFIIHRHGQDFCAQRLQCAGEDEIAGVGGDDDIERIEQDIGDEIERLLAAGAEEEVVIGQAELFGVLLSRAAR